MNVKRWKLYPSIRDVCLFNGYGLLLFAVVAITRTKDVIAQSSTLVGPSWVDKDGDAVFTCTPTSGSSVRRVDWRNSSLEETTDINLADYIIRYDSVGDSVLIDIDPSHYAFDGTVPGYPMTVQSVTLDDDGTYWCGLILASVGDVNKNKQMRVRVKPITISLMNLVTGKVYTSGDEPVKVTKGLNRFSCMVPEVRPKANFSWTYNSEQLSGSVQTDVPNADPRLLNSSSVQHVNVKEDNRTLICSAHNRQDGTDIPEQTLTVTLKIVKDPCEPSPCNDGTCTPNAAFDDFVCTCPDETQDPLCTGGAGSVLYRLDVILACLALTAVNMINQIL